MENQTMPKEPYFIPMNRPYLTEEELSREVQLCRIKVWGKYTCRGDHRKEVIEKDFDAQIILPVGFNKGHVKLVINQHIKTILHGIRARFFDFDELAAPEPVTGTKQVRDFMSDRGLRENERAKRAYEKALADRKSEEEATRDGRPPHFSDTTQYGPDGLPKFSDRLYVA